MKTLFSLQGFSAITVGIIAAIFLPGTAFFWLIAALGCLGLGIVLFILHRSRLTGVILLLGLVCLGGFGFGYAREDYRQGLDAAHSATGKTLTVVGAISERPTLSQHGGSFLIEIQTPLHSARVLQGRVTVYTPKPVPAEWFGHIIQLTGRFKASPDPIKGWPGFAEKRRIIGSLSLKTNPHVRPELGLPVWQVWADDVHRALAKQGEHCLQPANYALLEGMIFGDTLGEDPGSNQFLNELQRTGTIHLLSVSGLHVGFVVATLSWLLALLRVPQRWRILPLGIGIGFYILMTGMAPATLRSGLMMFLYSLSGNFNGAKSSSLNRLSLAALFLVLVNPYNLFEVGFQLSCAGTLGVVWLFPQLRVLLPKIPRFIKPLWDGILVSVCAQLILTPILIYYFQQISWSSPLVNLLLLLPTEIIVVGGLFGELLGIAVPFLGALVLTPVGWAEEATRGIVHFFGSQPWAVGWSPPWPWPWFVGYYLGIIILLDLFRPNLLTQKPKPNWKLILFGLLISLNIIIWIALIQQNQPPYLAVSVLDVGQGDSILIRSPEGQCALIDGGDEGKGNQRVLPYLRACGITHLAFVIATHGHIDHVGGLDEVLQQIPTETIYLPLNTSSAAFQQFLSRIRQLKITRTTVVHDLHLTLGDSISGEIVEEPMAGDENNRSLVLNLQYGKKRLFFTGDLSFEGEEKLMQKYPDVFRAEWLKVGHHGSNEATGPLLLTRVQPKLAVISVGAGNSYGHPGDITLRRLQAAGVTTYRTDRQGRIDTRVYADHIIVSTTKGDTQ